ncbi:unnamed protein product [Euphydryas editha]|uniref:Uncharacterized protein n=1 Tax=Euphydryas editha TaxID=104508 RepID=A0AAU9V305_EUPED|nr:unnamed protein product [Euphydryas editha]
MYIKRKWEDSEDGLDFSDDDDVADPTYNFQLNEPEGPDEEPEEPSHLENTDQSATTLETTSINTQMMKIVITNEKSVKSELI